MHPKFCIPILVLPLSREFLDNFKFAIIFDITYMFVSKLQIELLIEYRISLISSEELVYNKFLMLSTVLC
jgi:hypothetical protein